MVAIRYERNLSNGNIEAAKFKLDEDDDKSLSLTFSEAEGTRNLRLSIQDDSLGGNEVSVELGLTDGSDLIRVLRQMMRQIGNDKPPEITLP